MKWTKKEFDGYWNYSLIVNEKLKFQIETYEDGYDIWIIASGWYQKFMKVEKLETAKSICSEIAAVVEKYKDKE